MQVLEVFPGEFTPDDHIHITEKIWFFLMRHPPFSANWKSPASAYNLAASSIHLGMNEIQIKTLLRIWHHKHNRAMDERDMQETIERAFEKHGRSQDIFAANEYYEEVRRIQRNKRARQHQMMRISYSLTNDGPATAREIADKLGIPITTVYNNLQILKSAAKVTTSQACVNQIVESFSWDSGDIWIDIPAMYDHGQIINVMLENETRGLYIEAWDYTRDLVKGVKIGSRDLDEVTVSEWVVNASGIVVEHGTGIRFSPSEDKTSKGNPKPSSGEQIDYFARLG